ncbi:uncharacterized protein LOC120332839 [Styela clava]
MAESGKIREIDSSDESTEFSDADDQISVRNALQVSRSSMPGTVQEFGKNIFQSLVKHSEKHGTVVAPTFVFKQTIKEGDNIETSIAGSSGFTLDRSSNTYEKTSTTKQKAATSNDAVENETKGEIPFHFEDSIRVDHNLLLLYNERLAKYGEVYRGLQTHKGSRGFDTIAIKSIKLSDENRKEVEIIRKLRSHPNVITVLQSGTYFFGPIEHLFIAMEYFKSKTLTDFVKDDPKPKTDEVKHKQIEQFVEAVDHIHINEVLHRDLKPDNILVSDNGRILKIIDFGLGKQLRKGHFLTKMSTLRVGTDGWRAPEIYLSDICSKQSDIFSSALVIHFISTDGSHPFGNDPDSWNLNIKRYQGCDLSKLEGDLEDLVGWMLRFRPQDRPNTEQIRKHKYFRGQLVCPYPKLSLTVPKTYKTEIVKVWRESEKMKTQLEEKMKQMKHENEQEKRNMTIVLGKEIRDVRKESERLRRKHEKEMKRVQAEKLKMEIEIKKLKTEKKGAESQCSRQTTFGLRIINQQPSVGRMLWDLLRESLPGYEGQETLAITYSFPAGSLKGVSYEAQEFTEYLPWDYDGDICYNLLYQAFDAGLIFKIQEVGDRRGKIVWNDKFPHKTNKTGRSEINGYPDSDHTRKLIEALKAKGFKFDDSIPLKSWRVRRSNA